MLPGPDEIISCPQCAALATLTTWASGNTLGATRWSDGRLAAPMLPLALPAVLCPTCNALVWIEDCRPIGEIPQPWCSLLHEGNPPPQPEIPEAWRSAPRLQEVAADDIPQALAGLGQTSPDRRLAFLLNAWRTLNDTRRSDEPTSSEWRHARLFKGVCEQLLACLQNQADGSALLLAEVLRQMGRFAEAIAVLQDGNEPDTEFKRALLERCNAGDSNVFCLEKAKPQDHRLRRRLMEH